MDDIQASPQLMEQKSLDNLLGLSQYSLSDEEKNLILLEIIKVQLVNTQNNIYIKNFFSKQKIDIDHIVRLEDVPALPVQMFKYFEMEICPKEEISKILKSSGTTTGIPSRIPLSKNTTINQTKALISILASYLGPKRRLFVVIDHEGINSRGMEYSARTAGVRGLSIYAKKIVYLLKEENGELRLNLQAIQDLIDNHANEEVYVFGYTYIIWSVFYKQIIKEKINLKFADVKIFHSGGWKKLTDHTVSKELFTKTIARLFNTKDEKIYDFYGMTEQLGIIFVDCEHGNKHVPNFSQVIIRDILTLEPCKIGESGLIEVMSVLSDSYYCQAILTEDLGCLVGFDDCPCGRKGRYFRFISRVEKEELRGCGDTFEECQL
ncbi:LuxE/PaaK family acyltransferase [Methanosphaerula subterraneus]|uniref:LuxE/PaaK family acyltransferase n=1 Tax=Methanosphaerula subterraneus TaxID=3350244 RepID=UPI003F867058